MNVDTGHLIKLAEGMAATDDYEPIPSELASTAWATLGDKDETYINLKKRGPLQKFAKEKRKQKRKQAAKSRKINRK
jgi:hypothetical protein